MIQLRRKVVNRVKAKTLNGKRLTGSMIATLAENYVVAINNGAVPNIETAWNYICMSECNKALEEAKSQAETGFRDIVAVKLPMNEEDLHQAIKLIKKEAMGYF